ncbi:MAG: tetratricopeptide repeat protein [Candidatus Korobacteraceae bacterium]
MKKYITLSLFLVLLLGLSAIQIAAQSTGVKGVCKDQEGKFITDGVVELTNADNGRKMTAKTNKNGEYSIIGLTPGTYNAVLLRNGVAVDGINRIPIGVGDNTSVDFDLKKDVAAKGGPTEEQLKKQQEVTKNNEKIKGLNAKLAEARDLEKAGNFDQAVTLMQEATTAEPNQDLLWAYLGDAYVGAKKYPEAVDAYEKAVKFKPDNALYHAGLANAYAKANQPDKAVAEYQAAAQADPANAATDYFNMGAVYTNTGKVDDAITAFNKTIELKPDRADAYYWKGVNMIGKATLKGDKMVAPDGTAEAFNKYLELDPTGKYADAAKQMLASIGAPVETTFGKQKTTPAKKKPQ